MNPLPPSPCKINWDDMTGSERIRHCFLCSKNVQNLSAMTKKEAGKFLQRAGQSACIRFEHDTHGTISYRLPLWSRTLQSLRIGSLGFVSLVIGLLLGACAGTPANREKQSAVPPPPPAVDNGQKDIDVWVGGYVNYVEVGKNTDTKPNRLKTK